MDGSSSTVAHTQPHNILYWYVCVVLLLLLALENIYTRRGHIFIYYHDYDYVQCPRNRSSHRGAYIYADADAFACSQLMACQLSLHAARSSLDGNPDTATNI